MILDMMDEGPHMDMDWDWMSNWSGFPFEMSWMIMAMVFGGIILLITYILIARFVHNDAVKRGIPNPVAWLFIFLIFNFPGLIIYLIVRGSYEGRKPVQQTHVNTYYTPAPVAQSISLTKVKDIPTAPMVSDAKFCSMCGNKVDREGVQFCPQCGNKI